MKKYAPGCLVLNTEKMTVKLNKNVIFIDKVINRKQMLADVGNMKNVVQF